MGHDLSKQANRLAIAAVSHITQFDRDDLLELRTAFENLLKEPSKKRIMPSTKERIEPNLTRDAFNTALDRVQFFDSDRAIMDRLFTMLDKTGDDMIHATEFLVGISPLVKGNLQSKIALAFEMYDEDSTGEITLENFRFILTTITLVASYFGDPLMSKRDIITLTHDIMGENDTMEYTKNIPRIAQHTIMDSYVNQDYNE